MRFVAKLLVVLVGPVLGAEAAAINVSTCDDLSSAVALTAIEDTDATLTAISFSCADNGAEISTYTIQNNHLTIIESDDIASEYSDPSFDDVRFKLVSSGRLSVVPSVVFDNAVDGSVADNGGWLSVAEGCTARFEGDVHVSEYKVLSEVAEGGDVSYDEWDGGCVWNQGTLEVYGHATFSSCANSGGGESPPGRGGTLFNAEQGSIRFEGGVSMSESYLSDDNGNKGAGIYNAGEITVDGNSVFEELVADTMEEVGGAIFNAVGGEITFVGNSTAVFVNTLANHAGAIYNEGDMTFDGPALFNLCVNSAIYNVGNATLTICEDSAFFANEADTVGGGAISNLGGATLNVAPGVIFAGNTVSGSTGCPNIFEQVEANFYPTIRWTADPDEGFNCLP